MFLTFSFEIHFKIITLERFYLFTSCLIVIYFRGTGAHRLLVPHSVVIKYWIVFVRMQRRSHRQRGSRAHKITRLPWSHRELCTMARAGLQSYSVLGTTILSIILGTPSVLSSIASQQILLTPPWSSFLSCMSAIPRKDP